MDSDKQENSINLHVKIDKKVKKSRKHDIQKQSRSQKNDSDHSSSWMSKSGHSKSSDIQSLESRNSTGKDFRGSKLGLGSTEVSSSKESTLKTEQQKSNYPRPKHGVEISDIPNIKKDAIKSYMNAKSALESSIDDDCDEHVDSDADDSIPQESSHYDTTSNQSLIDQDEDNSQDVSIDSDIWRKFNFLSSILKVSC